MTRLLAVLGLLSALLATSVAQAASTPLYARLYGDINFALGGARHSDLDFYPGFVSLAGGAWIRRGFGVDVFVDEGLFSDEKNGFDFEITSASGLAARFQSPSNNGFFAYVVAGVVYLRIVQKEEERGALGARSVVQNYQGGRISVGIGQQLSFAKNLIVTGEYRNYFVDKDLQIDALSLGVRLSFR